MNWKCIFFGHKKPKDWLSSQEITLCTRTKFPAGELIGQHMGKLLAKYCMRCNKCCDLKQEWGRVIGDMGDEKRRA